MRCVRIYSLVMLVARMVGASLRAGSGPSDDTRTVPHEVSVIHGNQLIL